MTPLPWTTDKWARGCSGDDSASQRLHQQAAIIEVGSWNIYCLSVNNVTIHNRDFKEPKH